MNMITCPQCDSAERVQITQRADAARGLWIAECAGCSEVWAFGDN